MVFTAVHCPTAEVYEDRIKQLVTDYQKRDVAFVAIQPNNALAVRLDEMGYTDLGDSLEDMKIRAEHRQFNFPFLYDGETQSVSKQYGPVATPHIFIFDAGRKLRYHGRIDSNAREALAKVPDAQKRARCRPCRHARCAREDAGGRMLGEVARQEGLARSRGGQLREGTRHDREGDGRRSESACRQHDWARRFS